MQRIMYLGWIGHGNLGDELLWNVFKSLCDQYLDPNEYNVKPVSDCDPVRVAEFDTVVLGGGSLFMPEYVAVLGHAVESSKRVGTFGSGMDVLDQHQLQSLTNQDLEFQPSLNAVGWAQNTFQNTNAELVEQYVDNLSKVTEKAVYVGVRGPLTYRVYERLKIQTPIVQIVGDPGFLVDANPTTGIPQDANIWNKEERIVGLNWGTTYNVLYGNDEIAVENQLVQVAKNLIHKGYKIYLYSVWQPDWQAIYRLYNKINDVTNVRCAPRIFNQFELVNVLRCCCFTINFKLHANILSTVAEVPFIALGYRFKVFDFVSSVDLDSFVIATDAPNIGDEILLQMERAETCRADLRAKLLIHRTDYRNRLVSGFHRIFDLKM